MFMDTIFDGDVGNWNVDNITDMGHMFCKSKFNKDISGWNVSNVTNMEKMFENSSFDGDISKWGIGSLIEGVEEMKERFGLVVKIKSEYRKLEDDYKMCPQCVRN